MNAVASLFRPGRGLTLNGQNIRAEIIEMPKLPIFWFFLVLGISLVSTLVLAEEGATYTPENDRIVQTGAPAGKLPIEKKEDLAQKQVEHWNKVEENTGKEISYSYVVICDKDGHCMKVDPPKFVRF